MTDNDGSWNDDTSSTDEEISQDKTETLEASVKRMVAEVSSELVKVHSGKYDEKRAVRTAALALKAQFDLAEFLADVEGTAKGAKNSVKIIESTVYFDCRDASEKKISEAALQQMVAKDQRTANVESAAVEAEKTAKKWANVFNILKDAHIFFRNLGKSERSM